MRPSRLAWAVACVLGGSVGCGGGSGPATPPPSHHPLAIGKTGSGTGTVVSSPAAVDCGSTCSASVPADTIVTLTATPDATSTFDGWTGDCAGTSPTCSVTMDAAKSVTASFGVRIEWIGPTDGDWHQASSWSPAQVPTSDDAVVIAADVVVHATSAIHFQELTLGDESGSSSPRLVMSAGTEGPPGRLTIHDRSTLTQNTTAQLLFASVVVHAGGLIDHSANLDARTYVVNIGTVGDFTLEQGASIALDGLGYAGGPPPVNPGTSPAIWTILPGYGPGGGGVMYSGFYGGGAGHGGQGAVIPIYTWPVPPSGGGAPYDSETDPTDLGSGGGTGGGSGAGPCQAGAGGGAAILVVGGTLQLDGAIRADGADKTGAAPCGGGAGGTINLTAASAAGAGTLSADGGLGYGSGAGGRIAARISGANSANWAVSVTGPPSQYPTSLFSEDGTTYFPDWPLSRILLTPSEATLPAGAQQQFTAAGVHGAGDGQPLTASDGLVWGVDDPSIATIDASGLLTTVACGETRVTSTVGDVVGSAPLTVCSDVYVSTSGDDTSGDGSAASPYRTITFALSRTWPVHTVVHLAPGTYSAGETFPLRPADGVTLSGAGADQTTIAGNVSVSYGVPVGIVNYQSNLTFPQATRIEDLTIANSGGPAIVVYFESSTSASISPVFRDNVLIGTSSGSSGYRAAIVLLGHGYGGGSVVISPTITDNAIHGEGMPALMIDALPGATIAPAIVGNTVTAAYPAYASGAVTSVYLIGGAPRFERNTIAATNATALWMFSYSNASPLSPVFLANEISWTPPQIGVSAGVFLEQLQSGTGSLVFGDNTIAGPTTAIQVYNNDGTGQTDLDLGGGAAGSPGRNTIRGAVDLDNGHNTIPVVALDNWWSDTPPTRIVPGPGVSASPANAQSLSFDVSPAGGPLAGGTAVTLSAGAGTFFVDDVGASHRRIAVTIGGNVATEVMVSADRRQLTAVTPAGSAGAAAVVVTNPAGQSGEATFSYEPAP